MRSEGEQLLILLELIKIRINYNLLKDSFNSSCEVFRIKQKYNLSSDEFKSYFDNIYKPITQKEQKLLDKIMKDESTRRKDIKNSNQE
jgi:hypothetical protein